MALRPTAPSFISYNVSKDRCLVQSRQEHKALEKPLHPKSILFINNHFHAASGNVRALFLYALKCSELQGYQLFWDVQSLYDLRGLSPEDLAADCVHIVSHDAYQFRVALATCEFIVTSDPLPTYYVWRAGQQVVFLPSEGLLWDASQITNNYLRGLTPLLNSSSLIVADRQEMLDFLLLHRSPSCNQLVKTLITPQPYLELPRNNDKPCKVVIGFSAPRIAKSWSRKPDAFFDWVLRQASLWDIEPSDIRFLAPGAVMEWLQDGYITAPIDIRIYGEGLHEQLRGARIFLTNSLQNAGVAASAGVETVLVHRGFVPTEHLDNPRSYHVTDTIYDACSCIRDILQGDEDAYTASTMPVADEAVIDHDSCARIVDALLTGNGTTTVAPAGNKNLLLTRWTDASGFRTRLHMGLTSLAGTTLAMNDEHMDILEEERPLYLSSVLTYRAPFYPETEAEAMLLEEENEERLVELIESGADRNFPEVEWRRLLGDVHFDKILAPKDLDTFWRVMVRFAPANTVEYYDEA